MALPVWLGLLEDELDGELVDELDCGELLEELDDVVSLGREGDDELLVDPVEPIEPLEAVDPSGDPVELISPPGSVPLAAAANWVMCLRNSWSWLRTFGSNEDESLDEVPAEGFDAADPEVPVAPVSVLLVDPVLLAEPVLLGEPLVLMSALLSLLGPSSAVRSRSSAINCVFQ